MAADDWAKTATSVVAIGGSVVALIVSILNALTYYADREARTKQEVFENQLGITKIYFERLADRFCDKKSEATLLVQITDYVAEQAAASSSSDSGTNPISGLARVMRAEFEKRSCPGDASITESAPDTSGVATIERPPTETTYSAKERISQTAGATATRPANSYTVYVQYKADASGARQIQSAVDKDPRFVAPAIDQVNAVPRRNEIRIYKDTPADLEIARQLQAAFLPDARIVSLAKAYPGLQARTMEIWLKD